MLRNELMNDEKIMLMIILSILILWLYYYLIKDLSIIWKIVSKIIDIFK